MNVNETTTVTVVDALKIATQFLSDFKNRTSGDTPIDLPLGYMQIVSPEGKEIETSDPIMWEDWLEAAEKVLNKK